MTKTVVQVDGMACSMCEAHINNAIRQAFPGIRKVTSSRRKGETVILSEEPVPEEEIRAAIEPTGYRVEGVSSGPWQKKGLLGR